MNRKDLYNGFNEVDDDILERSETASRSKKKPVWLKWGAIAACLCLVTVFAISAIFFEPAESPQDTVDPAAEMTGPAGLTLNGVQYLISPHIFVADKLPGGFSYAGKTDVGGFKNCPYYTNSDTPEWIYVAHEVSTDGTVDSTGTLNKTEPRNAFVRYVDIRLRGKDIVCCNDEYYISMWSAQTYGSSADVSDEYYEKIKSTYTIRIEGDVPAGFTLAGVAQFSGEDTIPRGALCSNVSAHEVYINPQDPDVMLVPTHWYTHTKEESHETKHEGYNVYIRYECPLA